MRGTPSSPSARGLIVTLLVASAVFVAGVSAFEEITGRDLQTEYQENRAAFEEFCHAEYGDDAIVYSEGSAMNPHHSGLHCEAADGATIHLSQIPGETWTAYKSGYVDSDTVERSIEPLPPFYKPFLDALPVAIMVGVVTVATGLIQRYRSAPGAE